MKKILIAILLMMTSAVHAQIRDTRGHSGVIGFIKTKYSFSSRAMRRAPVFMNFPGSEITASYGYWLGSTITRYSINGRVISQYLFDTNGELRESRALISLKRRGILSSWKIQLSPQRHRGLLVYTIPR